VSLSILLVDDSEINLKVASLILKKLGHQADLATNGIDAIEALEHKRYDIVLTHGDVYLRCKDDPVGVSPSFKPRCTSVSSTL